MFRGTTILALRRGDRVVVAGDGQVSLGNTVMKASARKVRDLVPALEHAFKIAQAGVPGPVFLECPVDLLYDESLVRGLYSSKTSASGRKPSVGERALQTYLDVHTRLLFRGADDLEIADAPEVKVDEPSRAAVRKAAATLRAAERPVLVIGSQALTIASEVASLVEAVERLGVPVYLSGMARGLLGAGNRLQMRHGRRNALKKADVVILAGVPCDFRLDYGRQIGRGATYIAANRSARELTKNRRPQQAIHGDAGRFLQRLAQACPADDATSGRWASWIDTLAEADAARDHDIREKGSTRDASEPVVDPLDLCAHIDGALADDSVLVADGGDFVATASYIVRPRSPLSWLDPGVFGTLGVGAGFALGAKLVRPDAEVWILYGDGSVGYSLAEFDTFARHEIPVIAVVGNDACWTQIAREQVEILGDDVGCPLARTDYHAAAEGFGGVGFVIQRHAEIAEILARAKKAAADGKPVLVNAHLGKTDFRKGSISM